MPLFAIRRQADRLLYSFRVVSSEQAPVKTDQFFDLSIAAAQLPAKSKMIQSFEDFLIPSGYIKLHQVTSSCINPKKTAHSPTAKEKKVQRWAVNLLKPLHASLGILAPWITWITGKSHRLRGKKNEKSFQWELVLPC